jgi:quinol monooxygenase YgiN
MHLSGFLRECSRPGTGGETDLWVDGNLDPCPHSAGRQIIHTHLKEYLMARFLSLVAVMTLCLVVGVRAQDKMMKAATDGKVTVVVTHEVKDYATWRKGYDADAGNRKKAGFKVTGVYADVNNPNMVSIIGEFPSAAAADAFATSPVLKDAMEKAGVIGKPDVKVLTAKLK